MIATFKRSVANGVVDAPPSKSYTHRYLIAAALAKGTSVIDNIAMSNDILATLKCIETLGASYEIINQKIIINGFNKKKQADLLDFDVFESGSTYRFLIPIALTMGKPLCFRGTKTLISRGIEVYEQIFKDINISYDLFETSLKINGALKAGEFKIAGNISSQFITGLLFALPLLKESSVIKIIPPLESKNYVDMTIAVLSEFGITIKRSGNNIYIDGNQQYLPFNGYIEGDYSNAAFLEAYNYFDGHVKVNNLNPNSLQGDKVYQTFFKKLDEENCQIDISNCVDLGPVLMVFASLKKGATFTGTARLKIKESNRAIAVKEELLKMGGVLEVYDNEVIVKKTTLHKPRESLSSHNDHRIVMALALALTLYGGTISNVEAVNKSFPTFFTMLKKLGIEVELCD